MRQSFPRGGSKPVVVEKKRRRAASASSAGGKGTGADGRGPKALTPLQQAAKKLGLSEEELKRRQAAMLAAKAQQADREKKQQAEAEARNKRQQDDLRKLEEKRQAAAEEQKRKEAEAAQRLLEEAEAKKRAAARPNRPGKGKSGGPQTPDTPIEEPVSRAEKLGARGDAPGKGRDKPDNMLSELGGRVKRGKSGGPAGDKAVSRQKGEPVRRRQKLTITAALESEDGERQRSIAALKRARERERQRRAETGSTREKVQREVVIPEVITVQELANRMAERAADIVKYLMKQGQMVRAVDALDADTAELLVEEFGHTVKRVSEADVEDGFLADDDDDGDKSPRPPVVTVMGHVDHGKTSLLDALRKTDIVTGEAGGITQHIGAYQVKLKSGDQITFLDTPGHAAFSSMRARGATVTDLVILVVAADDGVMPQTIEAISHAKSANVPIIVAVNKIDKPDAKAEKVLQELLQHEIVVESMGGDVQAIPVSALKRTGLDELTEAITLQAEMLELKANPTRSAEGSVVESQLDKGRGPVATVLVGRGTLRRGDIVVAGTGWGKVRALVNERGQQLKEAGPATPVEILGLSEPPDPGEAFAVVENEARARELTEYRDRQKRQKASVSAPGATASLEQMMARLKDREVQEAIVVVKADVQGSAEAITQALEKAGNDEVKARVLHAAVGGVNESDVLLAKSTGAPIIAFNVRANKQARDLAEAEGVEIRYYSVIYDLINDVKSTLEGMLAPEKREEFLGYAEILQVFHISKVGKVAGCKITEGVVKRGCGVRLLRDDVVIHEGRLSTLKRFKDEVPEVSVGMECGMAFEKYQDLQPNDRIECFSVIEVERTLD